MSQGSEKKRGALLLAAKKKDTELIRAILEIPGAKLDFEEADASGDTALKAMLSGSIWEFGAKTAQERERADKESRELEACAAECLRQGADALSRPKKIYGTSAPSALATAFEQGRTLFLAELGKFVPKERILAALLEEIPTAPERAALDRLKGGEKMGMLLEWGLDAKGPKAADWLATCQSPQAAAALLSAGADPEAKASSGNTAVEEIARAPREKGSQIMALIAAAAERARAGSGADPGMLDGAVAAAGEGRLRDARRIAKAGGSPLAKALDRNGRSALMAALSRGKWKIAKTLLEESADPMEIGPEGLPAFAYFFAGPPADREADKRDRKEMEDRIRASGWLSWRGPRGESVFEALLSAQEDGRLRLGLSNVALLTKEGCRPDASMPKPLIGAMADAGMSLFWMGVALDADPSRERLALDKEGGFALAKALAREARLKEPEEQGGFGSRWRSHLQQRDFLSALGEPQAASPRWVEAKASDAASFALEFVRGCARELGVCNRADPEAIGQALLGLKELERRGLLGPKAWEAARVGNPENEEDSLGEGSLADALALAAFHLIEKRAGRFSDKEAWSLASGFGEFAKHGGEDAESSYWCHLLDLSHRKLSILSRKAVESKALEAAMALRGPVRAELGPMGFAGERARSFPARFPRIAAALEGSHLKAAADAVGKEGKGPRGM